MRLYQLFSLALLTIAVHTGCAGGAADCDLKVPYGQPFSCIDPNAGEGESQGPCNSGLIVTAKCNESNLTCIDGACIPCGYAGGPCCALPGEENCDVGICNQSESLSWPTCPGAACQIGDPCCAGDNCSPGGICQHDSHTCVAAPVNVCSGGMQFSVALIDQFGCIQITQPISSDNAADAQICANDFLAAEDPSGTLHLGPLNAAEVCGDFCEFSNSDLPDTGGSRCALTPQELTTCENNQCINCSVQPIACPP